jgi:hypothetical protein
VLRLAPVRRMGRLPSWLPLRLWAVTVPGFRLSRGPFSLLAFRLHHGPPAWWLPYCPWAVMFVAYRFFHGRTPGWLPPPSGPLWCWLPPPLWAAAGPYIYWLPRQPWTVGLLASVRRLGPFPHWLERKVPGAVRMLAAVPVLGRPTPGFRGRAGPLFMGRTSLGFPLHLWAVLLSLPGHDGPYMTWLPLPPWAAP